MTYGDIVFRLLLKAVDKDPKIEFDSYAELKLMIGWKGSVKKLRRELKALYHDPERPITFLSPRYRSYGPEWNRNMRKSLIVISYQWLFVKGQAILVNLKDDEPILIPPTENRSDFFERRFGITRCAVVLEFLERTDVIRRDQCSGSRGKVYETFSLV
jgi:hypothetical protein